MIDPLGPLRWDLRSNGRLRIRHHIDDLAAETPLVKLERRLALAVERQVRVDLHILLVRRDEDVLCGPPNGSRLSCGRNVLGRKEVEPRIESAGEATQFFLTSVRPQLQAHVRPPPQFRESCNPTQRERPKGHKEMMMRTIREPSGI